MSFHPSLECKQRTLHCHMSLPLIDCMLASECTSTLLQSSLPARTAFVVAVCRSGKALGTLKVGRWSRNAGGHCVQCSFYAELLVHGKTVAKNQMVTNTQRSRNPGFTVHMYLSQIYLFALNHNLYFSPFLNSFLAPYNVMSCIKAHLI